MLFLEDVLADPDVPVVQLRESGDAEAVERRERMGVEGTNRAVSAAVTGPEGALLLVRRTGDDALDGWRLPGSDVGTVTDLRGGLDDRLREWVGIDAIDSLSPDRVFRQTVTDGERSASLYYVVFAGRFGDRPDLSVAADVEAEWWHTRPDDLVNPSVVPEYLPPG